MKNNFLDTIILTIIFFGILILGDISHQEYLDGCTCSRFTIIPACYVSFSSLIILFIFQIFKQLDIFFIILAGFGLTFTLFASIGHANGSINCAISDMGIPLCYIGSALFFILLIMKFIQVKVERRV